MTPEESKENRELLDAWLEAEKKRQGYFSQFLTESLNGVVTHKAIKVFGAGDLEIMQKLDKDAEQKKNKFYRFVMGLNK